MRCKLFSTLLHHLLDSHSSAYVVLDRSGKVDLESFGWSVVPSEIQDRAVREALEWMVTTQIARGYRGTIADWDVQRNVIKLVGQKEIWCILAVTPHDIAYQ